MALDPPNSTGGTTLVDTAIQDGDGSNLTTDAADVQFTVADGRLFPSQQTHISARRTGDS